MLFPVSLSRLNVEYREVQLDLQNIGRCHFDVGPIGPRCMELPHDRLRGAYLQRLCSGRMEGLERYGLYSEVVGAQGLHRTRRPERRAREWQLSLGDEICARKDVLEHRNLQGSRRKQENRVNDVFL